MRGIARIAMTGPLAASAIAASFSLLALFFAPALLVSGAIVGLATLRHGVLEGLKVMGLAVAFCVAVLLLTTGTVGRAGAVVLLPWPPVWCAASVLRGNGRQGTALALLGAFVAAFAGVLREAIGDVDAFWRTRLGLLGRAVREQGGQFLSDREIDAVAGMMHQASIAVMCIGLGGMLLMARAWQAGLYRPGAFGEEFRALVLPRWAVGAMLAAGFGALLATVGGNPLGYVGDLAVVAVLLFAAQGLAVAHERSARAPGRRHWLTGLYIFAFLMPHVVAGMLAVLGIADQFADLRRLRGPRA